MEAKIHYFLSPPCIYIYKNLIGTCILVYKYIIVKNVSLVYENRVQYLDGHMHSKRETNFL